MKRGGWTCDGGFDGKRLPEFLPVSDTMKNINAHLPSCCGNFDIYGATSCEDYAYLNVSNLNMQTLVNVRIPITFPIVRSAGLAARQNSAADVCHRARMLFLIALKSF